MIDSGGELEFIASITRVETRREHTNRTDPVDAWAYPTGNVDREDSINSNRVHSFEERKISGVERCLRQVVGNGFDDNMSVTSQNPIIVGRLRSSKVVGFRIGVMSTLYHMVVSMGYISVTTGTNLQILCRKTDREGRVGRQQ